MGHASDLDWLRRDRQSLRDLRQAATAGHKWIPAQDLPFDELILFAYAADRSSRPTYVCLPSGLYNARTGHILQQAGPSQEVTPLPGIYFFDGWRVQPTLNIPTDLPSTTEAPAEGVGTSAYTSPGAEPTRSPEEEARDILATATKNQAEDGPSTRKAAIRACKYLRAMVNLHGTKLQEVYEAARVHTLRSKGTATAETNKYRPREGDLPVVAPELTSELLHCLSTLPDPWPLAKITINMDSIGQWVSKMSRLFFADEYARRTVGTYTASQQPDIESAITAAQNVLPKLETIVIEFLAEWLVTLLMPAKHVLDIRSPHLSFMFLKDYWFRELYLGLKVAASFDRTESYVQTIDGQIRCITPEFTPKGLNVAWNVHYINVFIPAWMVPPMYHSLRLESIKTTNSRRAIGIKSIRPTWFEEETAARTPASGPAPQPIEPMHGLRLIIREEVLPLRAQPEFPAVAELAQRGLLASETWHCNRPDASLKTTIDVPMLGTVIEQNGDGLLEDSLMPVGWPLHIDGAVRQRCVHRDATLQELDDLLGEYDMKRDLVELNRKSGQWAHKAVWNKWYMEPKTGFTLRQMWADSETDISKKTVRSNEASNHDFRRIAAVVDSLPPAMLPESPFLKALGTPSVRKAPPQTGALAQRALEESERTILENKAVAILNSTQDGRTAIIKRDGGQMLIAIV